MPTLGHLSPNVGNTGLNLLQEADLAADGFRELPTRKWWY